MITIGVSMCNARGEARSTKRSEEGVANVGQGDKEKGRQEDKRFRPLVPLSPCLPLPVCFLLFTQIDRVIEGNRYVFCSPGGDHRLFSDHRNLDSATAVFTNGVEAVSANADRVTTAPA